MMMRLLSVLMVMICAARNGLALKDNDPDTTGVLDVEEGSSTQTEEGDIVIPEFTPDDKVEEDSGSGSTADTTTDETAATTTETDSEMPENAPDIVSDSMNSTKDESEKGIYVATISPIGDSGVTGKAVVFVADDGATVGYAGYGEGLSKNLGVEDCIATNGCGVHIHDGTDCTDKESQGGHFFVDPITEDPWTEDRYSSDENGVGKFNGIVNIGTHDVGGRAFLIHAADGSRVGCGLLEPYDTSTTDGSFTELITDELSESGVIGYTKVMLGFDDDDDKVCFFGQAFGLTPDIQSVLSDPDFGSDCESTNGCGVHIHSGPSCETTETQGGHYYNKEILEEDPWALVGYDSTSASGVATFVDCVSTGHTEFSETLIIVHENDGSRVSCGRLFGGEVPDGSEAIENEEDIEEPEEEIAPDDPTASPTVEDTEKSASPTVEDTEETGAIDNEEETEEPEEEIASEEPSASPVVEDAADESTAPSATTDEPTASPTASPTAGDAETASPTASADEDISASPTGDGETETPEPTEKPDDEPTSSPGGSGPGTSTTPLEQRIFTAKLSPIGDSGVEGTVVVFIADDEKTVAYAGSGTGFDANLGAEDCTATNGCGVHIHSGFDCATTDSQGGHFFVDPVTEDPWTEDRLTTDETGTAMFSGITKIGTDDVVERVFLLHAPDGSRVACGVLEASLEAPDDLDLFWAKTGPLSDSGVTGVVGAVSGFEGSNDKICFFGEMSGLEPNLKSHLLSPGPAGERLLEKTTEDGLSTDTATDCTATNGCGAHVHEGRFCVNQDLQGGHLYNKETLEEDPWALVGYEMTESDGRAYFVGCVETGEVEDGFDGRVFIVHANDGSRVSCGPLTALEKDTSSAFVAKSVVTSALLFLSTALIYML